MANILELAHLADDVYQDRSTGCGPWHRINSRPPADGIAGFFGASYRNGNVLVLAFRGSETNDVARDWIVNDFAILSKVLPLPQIREAEHFTAATLASIGSSVSVYIAGHSLGGALTQVVAGGRAHVTGVTFNAPGMADHHFQDHARFANAAHIVNLRAEGDPVSKFGKLIGKGPITVPHGHGGNAARVYRSHGGGVFAGIVSHVASGVDRANHVTKAVLHGADAHSMTKFIADIAAAPIGKQTPEQLLAG